MYLLRSSLVPARTRCAQIVESLTCATGKSLLCRQVSTVPIVNKLSVEPLKTRKVVRLHGEEVVPFLQGLITNDLKNLEIGPTAFTGNSSIYAMFLNKGGRVLYDCIVYKSPDPKTYFIECDTTVCKDLCKHLRLYRVRRNIKIDQWDEYQPWVAYHTDGESVASSMNRATINSSIIVSQDPRMCQLGMRILIAADVQWPEVAHLFHINDDDRASISLKQYNYRMHRYRLGVGEGVTDLPPGKCFPLEANGDYLHGVSFHKGCYIGQELTARVHHTGVVRKRLMPVKLITPITQLLFENDSVKINTETGTIIGTLRGSCGIYALGLIRVEHATNSKLTVDGQHCTVLKPNWWPTELPKKVTIREAA